MGRLTGRQALESLLRPGRPDGPQEDDVADAAAIAPVVTRGPCEVCGAQEELRSGLCADCRHRVWLA